MKNRIRAKARSIRDTGASSTVMSKPRHACLMPITLASFTMHGC
jgi:hypothetical protein